MAVAGYEVQIRPASGSYGAVIDVGNVLTYQFTGLTHNTQYYARVRAYDGAGNRGPWSNELSVTTPQITLPTTGLVNDWWADDLVGTYTDGQEITSWPNRVAGGSAFVKNGSDTAPTFKSDGFNGRPSARFPNAPAYLITSDSVRTEFTCGFVFRFNAGEGLVTSGYGYLWDPPPNPVYHRIHLISAEYYANMAVAATAYKHVIFRVSSTGKIMTVYENGTQILNTSLGGTAQWRFWYMPANDPNPAYYVNGDIARVFQYDHYLSDTELANVIAALNGLYGL